MRPLKRLLRAAHVLDAVFFLAMAHALLTGDLVPRPLVDLLGGSQPEVVLVEPPAEDHESIIPAGRSPLV